MSEQVETAQAEYNETITESNDDVVVAEREATGCHKEAKTPQVDPKGEELTEWKDRAYRLAAEMENLKKRSARDVAEAKKYGVTTFARELLDVHDNLQRALVAMEELEEVDENIKPIEQGIKMVGAQLATAFEKMKIKEMEVSLGDKFNPEFHQAMFEMPTDEYTAGTIAQVIQGGYTIADRLLRPAMVGTAKKLEGETKK